jgi:S-adenosylmethionine-diacylglycerol 3-amino-3-carboxypropyl transferase
MVDRPAGLAVRPWHSPAQFDALAGEERMAGVLRQRLEKLACGFDLKDNYFAWQAFGRRYGEGPAAPLPPYLQAEHYDAIVDRVGRITLAHANLTEHLAGLPDASRDRYILLDAQDWMTDAQLSALWTQITRTARPGARILFRTAGEADIIPGRIPDAVLSRWAYQAEASKAFTAQDRSAIYGGVHLYILQDA